MRMVSFPVQGSSSSGTVVVRVPYQNWTLCVWSHFWYRALPVPIRSFLGFRPELNNMHGGYARWGVCGKCAHDDCDGVTGNGRRATGNEVDGDGDGATGYDDDDDGDGC
jgi:hypothetical protein